MTTDLRLLAESPQSAPRDAVPRGAPPDSIVADVIAACTFTVSLIGFTVSIAAFIFSGPLASGLPRAIGSFVVGSGVMVLLVARRTSIVPASMFVQEIPAILMATVAVDFIAAEGVEISDVFVLLLVTMVATAIATYALAHFKLGGLVRCLPQPLIGAVLGATGWLLFTGGFGVMTAGNANAEKVSGLRELFQLELVTFWAPGVALGAVAWAACRSPRVPGVALAAIISAGVAGFYTLVVFTSSVAAAKAGGWLLGPFPAAEGAQVVTPAELRGANWSALAGAVPGIAGIVGLTCIAQLFNLSGIRTVLLPQLDVDAELRLSARANLAGALFGMTPGFQGLGYAVLLDRLGATRRWVAAVSGGLVIGFGIVGVTAVGYVPRFVIGSLLVMTGMTLLDRWRQAVLRSASIVDRVLSISIVIAIAYFGLLVGIGFGVAATSAAFIMSYSRLDPVQATTNGPLPQSTVGRTPPLQQQRSTCNDRRLVVELQGYLFFGSLGRLEDRLRALRVGSGCIDHVVVDFSRVRGADSTAAAAVGRMLQELRLAHAAVSLTGIDEHLQTKLLAAEPALADHITVRESLFAALDRAEDEPLALAPVQHYHVLPSLLAGAGAKHEMAGCP